FEIFQKLHTSNYSLLAIILHNIARTFEDLHQYKEAVDRSRRAFGCDHAEVKVNQGDLDLLNWINVKSV
ncbi:unnamed protein product, partial [Rotaria sp. Silwood1]